MVQTGLSVEGVEISEMIMCRMSSQFGIGRFNELCIGINIHHRVFPLA